MEFILQQVVDNCIDFFNFSNNKIFNDEEMYSFFYIMKDFSTLINGMAIMMLEGYFSKLDEQLKLSRQSVKNLLHNLPTPPTTLQTEIEPKSVETVYIEVDEDHVSLQTGKNINMKLATVYTNKVDVGSNRMELVEKHSFTGLETPEEFWMQIDSYLAEAYVGSPKVYIIGDGARWIKRGLEVLPNSEFILDRFHLFKYMTKICGKRSRKEVFASLETNDKGLKRSLSYVY